jgi:hypothetical protein
MDGRKMSGRKMSGRKMSGRKVAKETRVEEWSKQLYLAGIVPPPLIFLPVGQTRLAVRAT